MKKLYQDEQWLREQYWEKELSLSQIGNFCDTYGPVIRKWMVKFGIPMRSRSEAIDLFYGHNNAKFKHYDWLYEQYCDKKRPVWEIAKLCNASIGIIIYWMKKFGIDRRSLSEARRLLDGYKDYKNRDWLYEQYWEKKLSAYKISKQVGVSKRTILLWLERLDIPKRSALESKHAGYKDESWLREQYLQFKKSACEIAAECDVSRQTILNQMKYYGIPIQKYVRSPSSIEVEIAKVLNLIQIKHHSQYRPEGYRRIYDEFIPPNIFIEIQGDYWHGPKRPKTQKRDAEKAGWAEKNGYHLVVMWEHEIKEFGAWPLVRNRVLPLCEDWMFTL